MSDFVQIQKVTPLQLLPANNLSDLASVVTALANLGIPNLKIVKTTVDLTSASPTLLYQPASGNFFPLIVLPTPNTITGLTSAGIGKLGTSGGAEFAAAATMPSVAGKGLPLMASAALVSAYTNGAPFYYTPTLAAIATALTADFYTIGLLI